MPHHKIENRALDSYSSFDLSVFLSFLKGKRVFSGFVLLSTRIFKLGIHMCISDCTVGLKLGLISLALSVYIIVDFIYLHLPIKDRSILPGGWFPAQSNITWTGKGVKI